MGREFSKQKVNDTRTFRISVRKSDRKSKNIALQRIVFSLCYLIKYNIGCNRKILEKSNFLSRKMIKYIIFIQKIQYIIEYILELSKTIGRLKKLIIVISKIYGKDKYEK